MCSALDFSIGKIEHLVVKFETVMFNTGFSQGKSEQFLVQKLNTLYNLTKNVVVFGTKRRTFWNIYSKNLEHLLTIYTKDMRAVILTVLFFCSARSLIVAEFDFLLKLYYNYYIQTPIPLFLSHILRAVQLTTSQTPLTKLPTPHYIIPQIQFKFKFRCALAAPSFLAGLSSSQDMTKPSSLGGTMRSREV